MNNDILIKSFNGYNFYKIHNISKDPRTVHIMYVDGKRGARRQMHYNLPVGISSAERTAYENEMVKKLLSDIKKADGNE